MVLLKRSLVLNAILLLHVSSATAKHIRSNEKRKLALTNTPGLGRFFGGDAEAEESFSFDIELQMSVPTAPEPVPDPTPQPTPAPVPGALPALFVDDDNQFDEFSLVLCQGDCDDDTDCAFGHVCFDREEGDAGAVPGCSGDPLAFGADDFCIEPPTANTLVIAGDEGLPESAFPLGECQGDCDDDDDCAEGLVCGQRAGNEPVPGCIGTGAPGWDYCFTPPDTEAPTGAPTPLADGSLKFLGDFAMDFYQLQECFGDCDFDSDCALGLVCWFRDASERDVPGCTGDATTVDTGDHDFCIPRPSDDWLVILADDDVPENFPLVACAGDCDDDSQCGDGLICFQRDANETVPGCQGNGEEAYDYCIPGTTP